MAGCHSEARARVVSRHVILCALRNLCHTRPVLLSFAKIPHLRFGVTSHRAAGLREDNGAVIPKRARVVNRHVILCALRNLCHTGPVLSSSVKIPHLRFGMTSQRTAGLREHDSAVIPKRARVMSRHVILCALRNLCHTRPMLLSFAKIPHLQFGMTSHRAAGLREDNGAVIPKRTQVVNRHVILCALRNLCHTRPVLLSSAKIPHLRFGMT